MLYRLFLLMCFLAFSFTIRCTCAELSIDEDLSLLIQQGGKSRKRYERLCQLLSQGNYEPENSKLGCVPDIYDTFWPFFCLGHLVEDPEACSSWTLEHTPVLEHKVDRPALAFIDLQLFRRIGDKWRLIPRLDCYCDYGTCEICKNAIIRSYSINDDYFDDYEDSYSYVICYRCPCLKKGKWRSIEVEADCERHDYSDYCLAFKNVPEWHFCQKPTIFPGYFFDSYRTYFSFFERFLDYQEQNPQCDCYWPVDHASVSLGAFVSLDWIARYTDIMQAMEKSGKYPFVQYYSHDEFVRSLIVHAYFYSDYLKILNDLDVFCSEGVSLKQYGVINQKLESLKQRTLSSYQEIYSKCLNKHPHPKIFYERGMVNFELGDNFDSIEDIRKYIAYAEQHGYQELLTSTLYLKEGSLLNESLAYDEAIIALTKAIEKDPHNADAYFERAIAYFETGDFSQALLDYLASGIHPKKIDLKNTGRFNSITFGRGITLGVLKGGQDSVTEFIPSLLSCLRGISRGIWAFVSSPIEVSQEMVDCAYICLEFIKDNTTKEKLCKLVPELQECFSKWDQLDDNTKGRYIGYVVGKYGVDIFITSGSVKAIQLYRNLRRANAVMTLETASISPKAAQEVLAQAAKEEATRSKLLKSGNLKIQWDKQAKHLPGKPNYLPGKSILEHSNPQKLINEFAGTGMKTSNSIPGAPGYREIINFKQHIGYHVNRKTGEKIPTTWGKIHYAKDGVHIVPTMPRK